jgi:tagatose-1,6-bisphosphate aldolase non-catalytic subunit AgaZ/GatZ
MDGGCRGKSDLDIHQQTHNQKGLEDALRRILAAGGNIT